MLRRLLIGLVLGGIVGGLVATGLVMGLHVSAFDDSSGGTILAYGTAALAGVLTGLVAGKPIWASGAKIEAGLKAAFGAALAAGLMFALRRWGPPIEVPLPLSVGGPGILEQLPTTALPLVAAVLGGFFEIDNTGGDSTDGKKSEAPAVKKRVAPVKGDARVATEEAEDDEGAAVASRRAKR